MILTEQHLESQVFKPPCYTNYSQALIIPTFLSVAIIILVLNLMLHQFTIRHEITQRTAHRHSHTCEGCDFFCLHPFGFNETNVD